MRSPFVSQPLFVALVLTYMLWPVSIASAVCPAADIPMHDTDVWAMCDCPDTTLFPAPWAKLAGAKVLYAQGPPNHQPLPSLYDVTIKAIQDWDIPLPNRSCSALPPITVENWDGVGSPAYSVGWAYEVPEYPGNTEGDIQIATEVIGGQYVTISRIVGATVLIDLIEYPKDLHYPCWYQNIQSQGGGMHLDLYTLVAHEIGHVLGLCHATPNQHCDDIMDMSQVPGTDAYEIPCDMNDCYPITFEYTIALSWLYQQGSPAGPVELTVTPMADGRLLTITSMDSRPFPHPLRVIRQTAAGIPKDIVGVLFCPWPGNRTTATMVDHGASGPNEYYIVEARVGKNWIPATGAFASGHSRFREALGH